MTHPNQIDSTVRLAELTLQLGETERITLHPKDLRPETVTTHSVMLGLVACAFARSYLPRLDLGRIAQYALVHDLPEALIGDTQTLRISSHQRTEKERREIQASLDIAAEFAFSLPWLCTALAEYQGRMTPEARYLWAFDKLTPKLVHWLNRGATFAAQGMTREDTRRRYADQDQEMRDAGIEAEFPELMAYRRDLIHLELEFCFPAGPDPTEPETENA